MEAYFQEEFQRISEKISKQLEKMKQNLPAAQDDIEFLDLLFRKLNSTREDERSLQIKATPTEVSSSNEKVPPEPAALEQIVSKPTEKEPLTEQLQKRKRTSVLVDDKASVDSKRPKKKSKVEETARKSAQSSRKTVKLTKTSPKNVSNEKQAKIVSVEPMGKMGKHFFVKEAHGVINKYRGLNIRTSKKTSKNYEANTLRVACTAKTCKGSHILRVLHPSAMIRSYTDPRQYDRQTLDATREETANPRNYEILSNLSEEHTCTNTIAAPIVIDSDGETRADQPKRRNIFEIFIKKETEG